MISRRLLRIKILQVIYIHLIAGDKTIAQSENELFYSTKKTYDLYHYLLLLLINLVRYAEDKIEMSRNKKIPTFDDLNPNNRFIQNRVIKHLKDNPFLNTYIAESKLNWSNNPSLVSKLFLKIQNSEYFNAYMLAENDSFETDKKILISIIENEIPDNEQLFQYLEDQNIYWNDDIELVAGMVIKTIEHFKENTMVSKPLLPLFKNEDDKDFAKTLFRKTIMDKEIYNDLIKKHTENWDMERIANIDILIMEMALAEILEFPSIPVKVTFNEYIDIAKFYSTAKSGMFINGILDKIVGTLKTEGKIIKTGRGLIG